MHAGAPNSTITPITIAAAWGPTLPEDTFCTGRSRRYAESRTPPAATPGRASVGEFSETFRCFGVITDYLSKKKLPTGSTDKILLVNTKGRAAFQLSHGSVRQFQQQPRDDKGKSVSARARIEGDDKGPPAASLSKPDMIVITLYGR